MLSSSPANASSAAVVGCTIHYRVGLPQPQSHLFHVTLTLDHWERSQLDLRFPVWTPGSYLVREYGKNLQDFQAFQGDQPLKFQKCSKNHWCVETPTAGPVTVTYRIYANELSVRTNHLDQTHGYFNGAALFFAIAHHQDQPHHLTIEPPENWQVTTTLEAGPGENQFVAADFDTLVDSPVEIGTQAVYDFTVLGKPHQLAVWGQGNLDAPQLIADTIKIIETEAAMFGGLPYDRYLFLLHLSGNGFGGLEHRDSCSLNYPRFGFRDRDKYHRFLQLVAHEFFHLWNVKRIRPQALETFDYFQENYTPSLWFCEGTTSYFDILIPLRSQGYDRQTCLANFSKDLSRYFATPGRRVQPLRESSFDAWVKLYRRDAYSDNNQISYYLKGEMVSWLLDLKIRKNSNNRRSLDGVMATLWQRFGQEEIGFTEGQLKTILEEAAGENLDDFYRDYLDGLVELPFEEYLAPFGLEIAPLADAPALPSLGLKVQTEGDRAIVKFVAAGGPGERAGLDAGDELLAINGFKITAEQLSDRLQDFQGGQTLTLTWFHFDQLHSGPLTLDPPEPSGYQLQIKQNLSPQEKALLEGWLQG